MIILGSIIITCAILTCWGQIILFERSRSMKNRPEYPEYLNSTPNGANNSQNKDAASYDPVLLVQALNSVGHLDVVNGKAPDERYIWRLRYIPFGQGSDVRPELFIVLPPDSVLDKRSVEFVLPFDSWVHSFLRVVGQNDKLSHEEGEIKP